MRSPRPPDIITVLAAFVLCTAPAARADFPGRIFHHDVEVITVTDMTDAGRSYPAASPAQPVYYKIIDLGLQDFGPAWAGEDLPARRKVLIWAIKALAEQGFRVANEQHPPTQLFVFAWGMLQGGKDRPALRFLGGDKADLMWEQEQYGGFVSPRVLLRGIQRVGIVGEIWDLAESNLFLGIVRSYTIDSFDAPKVTLLWETRFACPADGLGLADSMPLMIKAAALNFGRETKLPVNLNASDLFKGRVDLGELKILETLPTGKADDRKLERKEDAPGPR